MTEGLGGPKAVPDGLTPPEPPSVVVTLPPVLLRLFPNADRVVHVEASTVDEMIAALDARWPGLRDRLCDSTPRIRRHINVFVDGRRTTLKTPLEPGAEVFVITAISGG